MPTVAVTPPQGLPVARLWLPAAIVILLAASSPGIFLLLSLAAWQAIAVSVVGGALALTLSGFVFYWSYRSCKRFALANSLLVSLAASWHLPDLDRRALTAVMCGLGAKRGILAWFDREKVALVPSACRGLPPEWLDEAPTRRLADGPLAQAVLAGRPTFRDAAVAEPWFDHDGLARDKDRVVYVPLLSRQKVIAVMVLLGEGPAGNLGDVELLTAIGIAVGVVLDNARMYGRERQQSRQLLELSQQRTRLLADIAHELRTPLTSIKAAADMMSEEMAESDTPCSRLLQSIVRGTHRLGTLVSDLAEMARLESANLRLEAGPTVVPEMVEAAVALMDPLLRSRKQRLELNVAADIPNVVVVDRRRFEQILVNLLANAHHHTPRDGVIRVDVRRQDDNLVVGVSDTGPGVPAAERDAIFQPFYQGGGASSLRPRGMGLGLAIAKSLAEMHGGRLWLESNDGQGSTFYLSLPIVGSSALSAT